MYYMFTDYDSIKYFELALNLWREKAWKTWIVLDSRYRNPVVSCCLM